MAFRGDKLKEAGIKHGTRIDVRRGRGEEEQLIWPMMHASNETQKGRGIENRARLVHPL